MTARAKDFDYRDKLSFVAEWHDYNSGYHKNFVVNYYPSDNTLDIFDKDLDRLYLKRTTMDSLDYNDMYVGNTIRVYGRQIKLTDYADCKTKSIVSKTKERTFAILTPCVIDKLGEIITQIQEHGFHINRMRMCILNRREALEFYEDRRGDSSLPFLLEHVISGPVVAMELVGKDAVSRWAELMGPSDPIEARRTQPESLRAVYGRDSSATSGFHGSHSANDVNREANFFFPGGNSKIPTSTVQLNNTTCCVVKPHAITEGKLGYIITAITEANFKVTAAQMFYLSNADADEFLEVYKGVVTDYHAKLCSFVDGPCVALEIAGKDNDMNVYEDFRRFCGPEDAEIARQIRPGTLRAKFGIDKYKNAVHCTDLPEDTVLELEYFFKVLKD
ncbi:unnamed protein product [Callosobruchus maculatus]|uniref:DM10 domain-containing protein n=2 Tax=Callosobruchus maculatus TaxID=64391 RepID=A0A653D718_CALMS|nr:unnamed protein product [Callosobruchus maculatus]